MPLTKLDSERLKAWSTTAVVGLAIFALFAGLRYAISPHHFDSSSNNDPNRLPPNVAVRLTQSIFTGRDDQGRKSWIIHADRVDSAIDHSRIEFSGHIDATLLDSPTGKTRARVSAPTAVFTAATKTLQVGGKIVCRVPGKGDASDLHLEADTLLWNVGAKQIICPGAVHSDLPQQGGTADGRDLTMDLVTHEWTLKRFHGAFLLLGDGEPGRLRPAVFSELYPEQYCA